MRLQGHAAFKYVTGARLGTSATRGWSNVLAERWSHDAGELPSVLPRDTELAVLLSGRTLVDRQGGGLRQSTPGQRGTAWLCPSGIREEFINFRQPLESCLHIFLPAKPFADCVLQDFDIDPAGVSLRYEAISYDAFIEQVALAIDGELRAETSAGSLLVESLGRALSAHLLTHYPDGPTNVRSGGRPPRRIDERRMARVLDFIEAHIERVFTVADMAAVACMSPAHFARAFKATTGLRPHEYVSRRRLELAKQLLEDDQRSLADIALSTSFSSQSNFSRAFRGATGMTPRDYRARRLAAAAGR